MTMQFIASGVTTTTTSNITFTTIPQNFTHLQARVWGKGTFNNGGNGLSVIISFNGFTPLYRHRLQGNGANAISENFSASWGSIGSIADVNANASTFGVTIFDILDYTNPNKNKTLRYIGGFDNNGNGQVCLGSSLASGGTNGSITTLDFSTDGNWVAGCRVDLYGITTSELTGA